MVPMHYGTFWLSEEPLDEPLPRLLASAKRMGLSDRIAVVREGETRVFRRARQAFEDRQAESVRSAR